MKTAACVKNIIDYVFLCLLGGLILGYAVFSSTFAQMAVSLPFLDFPIFVGEIALSAGIVWGMVQILSLPPGKKDLNFLQHAVILFSAWILLKAFVGYMAYGPLSFRNAALFYYSWFAVVTYYLAMDKRIVDPLKIILFVSLFALVVLSIVNSYYLWFSLAIMFALSAHVQDRRIKRTGIALIIFLALFKFPAFFIGSRSHLVSMLAAMIFLFGTTLGIYWSKSHAWQKLIFVCMLLLVLAIGVAKFSDRNQLTSMTTPRELMRIYQERVALIKEREANYVPADLSPQLYHPNVQPEKSMESIKATLNTRVKEIKTSVTPVVPSEVPQAAVDPSPKASEFPETQDRSETQVPLRSLDNAYGNIVFRLFIWRDMLIEMKEARSFLGINFGKPQRSRSLEISRWAMTEWTRDGWITPHNSFLHMIYRGGIIGLLYVVFILGCVVKFTLDFVRLGSFAGLFLVSALIYWIVLSQFLVILELPYIAVPFWVLMGMTLVYDRQIKRKTVENTSRS